MKVYLIFGHTGHYVDCTTWLVKKCFTKKESAVDFKDKLETKIKELNSLNEGRGMVWEDYLDKYEEITDTMRELDPNFRLDYTGVNYEIEEAEIES